jgi:uncharacterized membrane protein
MANAQAASPPSGRVGRIDVLRGLVMVVMALDHTRDFFYDSRFGALDLAQAPPELFFTRWVTHFCAPVFVVLAGLGSSLSLQGGRSAPSLAVFLAKRGLWLVFLEIFVVSPLGWRFSFSFSVTLLQVIWAIGLSMIALGGLILFLKRRQIGYLGLATLFTLNLSDVVPKAAFGPLLPVWSALHDTAQGVIGQGHEFLISYPFAPWFAVMAIGFGFGDLALKSGRLNRSLLVRTGLAATALFLVLRTVNLYGDPSPWRMQDTALRTVQSFLNVTKYPASLDFFLMTLGPAALLLAALERAPAVLSRPFETLGRVPLFYYLLHLPLLHAMAAGYYRLPAATRGARALTERGLSHDMPLYGVYLCWMAGVLLLFPVCAAFAKFKRTHKHPLLSYL